MQKFDYLKSFNAPYIEEVYERYQKDPESVEPTWRFFFEGLELGTLTSDAATIPSEDIQTLSGEAKVAELISAWRERGRLLADINPLQPAPSSHTALDLGRFGLSNEDLGTTFTAGELLGIGPAPLAQILERLRSTYAHHIGVEYSHIEDTASRQWLQDRMEATQNREALSAETKKFLLKRLCDAEGWERFLHTRYTAKKRFSLEGGETLITALDQIIESSSDAGVEQIVMGMAHRGRLNVLTNIFGKPPQFILTEFEEEYAGLEEVDGLGDVKYHMGFSADIRTRNKKTVHLSMAHNPSHLEFVNPVVEGMVRAKQRQIKDTERSKVLPVLMHGDAAFAGQGVVYETLNLSQVPGYHTGGTLHIISNNQVGFTTNPSDARSTTYATDVAKMLEVPIFHVNGDDPEAVWFVAKLAVEFRQKFKKDVVIDLISYRKYGHNEGDEPAFTQPSMYRFLKTHPSTRELYQSQLIQGGVVSDTESQSFVDAVTQKLSEAQQLTKTQKPKPYSSSFSSNWSRLVPAASKDAQEKVSTLVDAKTLNRLSAETTTIPPDFNLHPKLKRFFEARHQAVTEGKGLDWGNGESLAYASLLAEGHPVRLSGQDVERGTFTHRHAVLNDTETGRKHCPLKTMPSAKNGFLIFNSTLSETAVLGFEYGWSLSDPEALVIWEAQFGDFANGAQVIIDQFICSSEAKWNRSTGLVLLLPHGYEGQGPEHSSARLERFLQLCARRNMSVCNFTTPANLFHALRRQVKRNFRRPLVVMSPKSLLRHPKVLSDIKEFSEGQFRSVLADALAGPANEIQRVVLCSGKIYYDLLEHREHSKKTGVALIRIEELYPWPADELLNVLTSYPKLNEIAWAQEEPQNQGAWSFVAQRWPHLKTKKPLPDLHYVGRKASAAPAAGAHKTHGIIQQKIMEEAFGPLKAVTAYDLD